MKQVTISQLDTIVKRNEVCLLDMTHLTIQFVKRLVNHSPGNIATKQGNKRLPLEMWWEILAWAEMTDPNHHTYRLVQALSLEEHGTQRILACAKIPKWNPCGLLETEEACNKYRACLKRPGKGQNPNRPFVLPDTNNQDSLIKIKDSLTGRDSKILFRALSVSDVISRAEKGECFLCASDRWCFLPRDYEDDGFFGFALPRGITGSAIPCPLCIDVHIPESMDELESVEYEQATRQAFYKLGYTFHYPG
ncbi:hypothetical protein NCS52_01371100 [Fusarium sp. LHS14.1]|nr:hypothetical protein NCS52_01371100 [Fusarium sp. LHS14.1]